MKTGMITPLERARREAAPGKAWTSSLGPPHTNTSPGAPTLSFIQAARDYVRGYVFLRGFKIPLEFDPQLRQL